MGTFWEASWRRVVEVKALANIGQCANAKSSGAVEGSIMRLGP